MGETAEGRSAAYAELACNQFVRQIVQLSTLAKATHAA